MHRRTHISKKLVISVLKSFLKACHFKMHKITHGGENLFLVISVPSHFLDLTTWRCTEELILERNYFSVISVPSYFLQLVIWRCIKEFIQNLKLLHISGVSELLWFGKTLHSEIFLLGEIRFWDIFWGKYQIINLKIWLKSDLGKNFVRKNFILRYFRIK